MVRITEGQIIATAETLTKTTGKTPTWQQLRDALGSGSPSTLNKYYRDWRKRKDAELLELHSIGAVVVENLPVPLNIIETISTAWSNAISEVKSECRMEIDAIQNMLKKENDKLKGEIEERDEIINTLEVESVQNQELIDGLGSDISVIEIQLVSKVNELAIQTGRNQELEKQLSTAVESALNERKRADDYLIEIANLKAQLGVT